MQTHAQVVIIGAGIVGCSAAYHLARKGWRDVVVLDQGPLFETGGSSSRAPGVVFYCHTPITGIDVSNGRVQALVTPQGRIAAELVLICAGIWGPRVGRLAGVKIPLTPVQHQYAETAPLPELAGETREVVHPIVRHQDKAMYFRQHANCYGVGSYQHEPLLVEPDAIRRHDESPIMPSLMEFTPE